MEAILRRERLLVATCLAVTALLAWAYLVDTAAGMAGMSTASTPDMAMGAAAWTAVDVFFLFLMWAVMMVAMMVPSATPMALAFLSLNQRRRVRSVPVVSTWIFVLGYVAVWSGYALAATLAQWGLHRAALISSAMALSSPLATGGVLVAAGVYQWTPWKYRCLAGCRSPLSFLMSRWREGRWGAWVMGLEHGAYCVGCCWVLMALLFVAGVMNLPWVAVITAFVIAEKLAPGAERVGKIAGVLLVLIGIASAVRGF